MLTMNKLTMKMRLFAAFLLLGLWGATAQTAREQIAAMPGEASRPWDEDGQPGEPAHR